MLKNFISMFYLSGIFGVFARFNVFLYDLTKIQVNIPPISLGGEDVKMVSTTMLTSSPPKEVGAMLTWILVRIFSQFEYSSLRAALNINNLKQMLAWRILLWSIWGPCFIFAYGKSIIVGAIDSFFPLFFPIDSNYVKWNST